MGDAQNPGALSRGRGHAGEAPPAPAYRIVGTKLAALNLVHKAESLRLPREPTRHDVGIVLEQQ